ncbi:MAG: hypothetical protein EOP07_12575 [Proteobacteria bacterium]|nr:MAG: hypothetical protein EOP07_12575 [Pseudomonadota bacterium]
MLSNAFLGGLSSNFTNLDHICFSLVSGLLLFATYRKPWLLLAVFAGTAFGVSLAAEFGRIPLAQFFVGLSMILLAAMLSLPQKFDKYLILTLAAVGMLHGMLHVNRWGPFATFTGELDFTFGVLLGLALLSIGFGMVMKYLSEKSKAHFQEVEQILVAIASGAALASIVISFS